MIVETGNLRKAADLMGISHSGLSKSIKSLEEELGFRLLLPSGRGIGISDEGKRVYERAPTFFSELEKLSSKDIAKSNIIRLGSFEVFTSFFIGEMLKNFFSPSFEIEIHELIPGKLEEALLLGKIDLGITYEPIPRKGIEYVKAASLHMAAYALHGKFKHEDIRKIPFAVPVNPLEGTPSGVKGLDAWPEDRFKRIARYRVDLMASGLDLVRRGLCAIFIPEFVAKIHNQSTRPELAIEALPLPRGMAPVKREVFIVKRESTLETQDLRQIARALRSICS